MSFEVQSLNMGRYDSSYLTAVRREMAHSVKPNVLLDDMDNDVMQALLLTTTDAVNLSPEAKAFLQKLRKKLRENNQKMEEYAQPDEKDFGALLQGLSDFRNAPLEEKEGEEKQAPLKSTTLFPPSIQLSEYVPGGPRPKTSTYSPVRETLDRMVYYSPTDKARKLFQDELEPFGFEIVSQIKSFGVRAIILERNRTLSQILIKGIHVVAPSERTFDGRPWDIVRGLYDSSRHLFVIGEEQLGNPHHSTARHEFAHAFDHAFSERNNRRLPLSVQLWNLFRKERTGMVTEYANTNPAEYFAESVETYFHPKRCEVLKQKDPKMYSYLNELFALR